MKKQFFSKLLMAAMFVSAVGSFQSCKDYDGDIAKIEQNASVLQGQVTSLENALNTAKSELAAAQAAADKAVKAAEEAAKNGADANAVAKEAKEAVDALAKTAVLQENIEALEKAINDVKAIAEGKVDQKTLDAEIAKVAGRIDAIDPVLNQLTEGIAEVATLKGQIESNKKEATEAIEALQADMAAQKAVIENFTNDVTAKLSFLSEESIMTMLEAKIAEAESSIMKLQERLDQIDANSNSISEIKSQLESMQASINGAVEKMDNVSPYFSTLNVMVDNALTSLVLKPTLYYGGIEAVEAIHGQYQPLGFSIYYADEDYNADRMGDENALNNEYDPNNTTNWRDWESAGYAATSTNAYDITYEYAPKNDLIYKYPTIDAYYHINPKHLTRAEIGDIAINTEDLNYVNTTQTRAERNSYDIALDVCGPQVYKIEDGLLHAYFTNSADMWHRIELYGSPVGGQVTVVSLEATAPTADGTRTVTSDWGAVARVHQHGYCLADNDATITHYETYPHIDKPQDTDCGMMDAQQYTWTEEHVSSDDATRETKYNRDIVHVYRQARWAIENPYTHTLKWDGTAVDLDQVIEVHALHHYYDAGDREYDLPVDIEKLGFARKYTIVNYQYPATQGININGTEESQHAHIEDGHLLKANFITNGKRDITKTSRTSIGREPLVMIELIDTLDEMAWNPDHMNWEAVVKDHNPRHNLVAVGFIKFKIVDETDPTLLNVKIDLQNENMYASCAGDTILTNWYEVEEQILDAIKVKGLSISKSEFESNYILRGVAGEEYPFRELIMSGAIPSINGQVYVPYTRKTQIIGTRQNWVSSVDLSRSENWVLPQVVLNGDITEYDEYPLRPNMEQRFVDPDRYGNIVYTTYDWLHRETNLIGVTFTAEQMLQQLVKRDHEGVYLDSLGNKVAYLSEADFYPYVDTKVAAKLVDPNHNGWPEVTICFQVRVHLNKATMNRPLRDSENGNWYAITKPTPVYGGLPVFINANVDPFKNGEQHVWDVRRFVMNLQQCLKNQRWLASLSNYPNAFDFFYSEITGDRAAERIGIQKAKLGRLHGDLYFYTKHWLGDIEEGTPYWHDGTKDVVVDQYNHEKISIEGDKFYADKYLIKVCYTKNPLDTVVWAQEAMGKRHIGKLGKYLFAYKYIENHADYRDSWTDKTGDPRTADDALVLNYTHFDMAGGELIAWIDNYDTYQAENSRYPFANLDREGNLNENVNVHLNFNSKFAQDLLNRAGRYAESNSGTQNGYDKSTDNPFSVYCHLSLFEGDCILAVNPVASERAAGQDYIVRPDYVDNYALTDGSDIHHSAAMNYVPANGPSMPAETEFHTFFHRPAGVPVMLNNPDFVVRFLRPISVEFQTPWQTSAINAVEDAVAGNNQFTVTYVNMFRNQTGSPYSRIFPMDWRNYTQVKDQKEWIQYYQGKMNPGVFNDNANDGVTVWNQAPWKRTVSNGFGYINGFKYMDLDRSSINRGSNMMFYNWNNWVYTPNYSDTYADSWNEMNVVPMVDHMLTNYDGTEGFLSKNIAIMDLQITHNIDPTTGNIKSTTFTYTNDLVNRGPFDILIPVTVKYAWGDITTTGKWESTNNIQRTNDRYFHNANMNYIKVHFGPTIAN